MRLTRITGVHPIMLGAALSLGVLAAASFTEYPAFVRPGVRVEAVVDRGPIRELIVRCRNGTGILSYSKIERTYCTPDWRCAPGLDRAISRLCR